MVAETLVVADLGYFGFAWFDWLRAAEQAESKDQLVIHIFYERGDVFDGIVWLGADRASAGD